MLESNKVLENCAARGPVTKNAPLGAQSWFRCGGNADLLFEPADMQDLMAFLQSWPKGEPLTILGGMANTIIRDGGVRGCVIRLGKPFADIAVEGNQITVGAGALNGSVAAAAAKAGIGGLEFLSGIPGTVGGALAMNAGAYGREVKDILIKCEALNFSGRHCEPKAKPSTKDMQESGLLCQPDGFLAMTTLNAQEMGFSYRKCTAAPDHIFLSATFQGQKEEPEIVRAHLKEIKQKRNETQPIRDDTGGSTFANPSDDLRAWQVVEKVGGRGLQIGGAKMSEMHCNFMINTGNATAADLEDLGDDVIRRAKEQLGITLKWEIKRIGER